MPTLQETLIDLQIGLKAPLSQKILDTLNNASSKDLSAIKKSLRFGAIASIVKNLKKRFPIQKGLECLPIPIEKTQNEQQALLILSRDLQFSDDYQAIGKAGLKRAIKCLSYNLEIAKNWLHLQEREQIQLTQQMHNAFFNGAQNFIQREWNCSLVLSKHPINFFQRPATICPIQEMAFYRTGFVKHELGLAANNDPLHINTHPDTTFSDVAATTKTTIHESKHLQDKSITNCYILSEEYGLTDPEIQVPSDLIEDAKLLDLIRQAGAYIPPRIRLPYPEQGCEFENFILGDEAEREAKKLLGKDNPAQYIYIKRVNHTSHQRKL